VALAKCYNDDVFRRIRSLALLLPLLYLPEDTQFRSHQGRPGFIAIPYWFIAALLLALSIRAILRRRSQRARFLPGHCRACGYDLRGSNGRCPECGQDTGHVEQTTSTTALR